MIDLHSFTNMHFAYSLSRSAFVFLDDTIPGLFDHQEITVALLMSRIHPDDVVVLKNAYPIVVDGKFKGSLKFRVLVAGAEQWLNVTPFLNQTDNETVIYGHVFNITDEVKNFNSIARYANKKNSVLHMLAHDLRGPLSVANSLVKVLDKEIPDPAISSKTHSISAIIQEAIDLITNLTKREFLDTLEVALVRKRIDVVMKLEEYLEECRLSSAMASRTFNFFSSEPNIFVELDEAKFMQVINNLVANALKFTRDGGIISIALEERPDCMLMTFSDDGIGIPADLLPAIFDKFTTSGRPGLKGEPSVGLGLSIVKTILEWHNGKIWCESEPGKGTKFSIEIPKTIS